MPAAAGAGDGGRPPTVSLTVAGSDEEEEAGDDTPVAVPLRTSAPPARGAVGGPDEPRNRDTHLHSVAVIFCTVEIAVEAPFLSTGLSFFSKSIMSNEEALNEFGEALDPHRRKGGLRLHW